MKWLKPCPFFKQTETNSAKICEFCLQTWPVGSPVCLEMRVSKMGQFRNSTKIYSFSWEPTHLPPLWVDIRPGAIWSCFLLLTVNHQVSKMWLNHIGNKEMDSSINHPIVPPFLMRIYNTPRPPAPSHAPSLHCAMQLERSLNSAPFPRASGHRDAAPWCAMG